MGLRYILSSSLCYDVLRDILANVSWPANGPVLYKYGMFTEYNISNPTSSTL